MKTAPPARVLGALAVCALALPGPAQGAVRATPFKRTDAMTVRDQGRTIEIVSPSGVGSGELLRTGKRWPSTMKVRVKGPKRFEHFKLQAGATLLLCGLERAGGVSSERVCRLGAETVLPPVEAGAYFEITVPPALLATQEESMVVEWVDSWK